MPNFDTPPDWWLSLANLTDWFEWPAIAAFLTALVLWNTARLADRANRRENRRDASYVLAGAQLIDFALTPFEDWERKANRGPVELSYIELVIQVFADHADPLPLNDFDATRLPTVLTNKTFNGGRMIIAQLHNEFTTAVSESRLPDLEWCAGRVRRGQGTIARLRVAARDLVGKADWEKLHNAPPSASQPRVAQSLKFLTAWLRTTWTRLPFAKTRQRPSDDPKV